VIKKLACIAHFGSTLCARFHESRADAAVLSACSSCATGPRRGGRRHAGGRCARRCCRRSCTHASNAKITYERGEQDAHRAHVVLADDAVRGPEEEPGADPLEGLAAPADDVAARALGVHGVEEVALREPVLVREGRVLLEELVELLRDEAALGVVRARVGAVLEVEVSEL
jgi:hypothetical protein